MTKYALIAIGGGIGSMLRYFVGTAIMQRYAGMFPLGTFTVNVTGSFLVGLLATLMMERFPHHPDLRLMIVVGFLGGYTTFSSFEYEILQTVRGGSHALALLYLVSSVVAGYVGVWLGATAVLRFIRG